MKFVILLLVLTVFIIKSESVLLDATCSDTGFYGYKCQVENSALITSKDDRDISKAKIQHKHGKTDENVVQFDTNGRIVKFFPRGLTKLFKSIKFILMSRTGLQEIAKEDLQEFGNILIALAISSNEIRVIEVDLFEFNPNLEQILIRDNQILHLDFKVFEGLKNLKIMRFCNNSCIFTCNFDSYNIFRTKISKITEFELRNVCEEKFKWSNNVGTVKEINICIILFSFLFYILRTLKK